MPVDPSSPSSNSWNRELVGCKIRTRWFRNVYPPAKTMSSKCAEKKIAVRPSTVKAPPLKRQRLMKHKEKVVDGLSAVTDTLTVETDPKALMAQVSGEF